MKSVTCSKCGWVYPIQTAPIKCRFCKTPLPARTCPYCGKIITEIRKGRCVDCYHKTERIIANRYTANTSRKANEQYKEWLDKIASIPKPYKTLTEDEWLKAVAYFNGCAYCGSDSVDTRGYFIPFQEGGAYTSWNILPVCEACTARIKKQPSPFRRYISRLGVQGSELGSVAETRARLKMITDYLANNMEEYLL